MKSLSDSDEEEFGEYQKKLRERANRSILQLTDVLGDPSSEAESMDAGGGQQTDSIQGEDSWHQLQHSDAVNQLRSLLLKQEKETNLHSTLKGKPVSELQPSSGQQKSFDDACVPAVQDLVPILQNQSEYIRHLEAEVKFCKEELVGMKQRIRVVVLENEKLHRELKSKAVEETLKDYTILEATTDGPEPMGSTPKADRAQCGVQAAATVAQQLDTNKWQNELAQLKLLYQAQTQALETQVLSLRRELTTSQKETEEVKGRLRRQEAASSAGGGPRVGGLCLQCAQQEAHGSVHAQAVERLTKERDELLGALSSLRATYAEMQQREHSAYQQVKQAVEMAEEASLEKARAQVQCEQVRGELARQRERLERELLAEQERLTLAREGVRKEVRKEKEELAWKVTDLSQKGAQLQSQLDWRERERSSLSAQLEDALKKLGSQEEESSKVCADLRLQVTQCQLRREEAERALQEQSTRSSRQLELAAQEAAKLAAELSGCRQRLEAAQRAAGVARAEALGLTERLGRVRHQLHLTRKEKEMAERDRNEEVVALTSRVEECKRELMQRLCEVEEDHQRSVGELESLLSSQNSLIGRLREECHGLGAQLEEVTESSRVEVQHLSQENQHLQDSVEKLRGRCQEMEEQCVQHGRMHQRMKQRLQQLDQHSQASAQQVLELLNRQNQLMQERQALSEEMRSLRARAPAAARPPT
ncbi:serologically defined colon cancer antigen 8 homolog isoform X2 [Brienomyrus brachyistius]|uniref:serologically defined colon cancer antigen 8 homolog isoform X2 n=1 Tax=Brienomyrus brachyistius TaxID=42636 RepID=UPI0020B25993|nr:serologically defined colon cancer antigen 8 homolog isoform X2 [Brienomyrus brachyistius]